MTVSWVLSGTVRSGARAQPRFRGPSSYPACAPKCKARTDHSKVIYKCGRLFLKLRRQGLQQGGAGQGHGGDGASGVCRGVWKGGRLAGAHQEEILGNWVLGMVGGRGRSGRLEWPRRWAQREWVGWRGPSARLEFCALGKHVCELGPRMSRAWRKSSCDLLLHFRPPLTARRSRPQGAAAGAPGWGSEDLSPSCGVLKRGTSVLTCAEGAVRGGPWESSVSNSTSLGGAVVAALGLGARLKSVDFPSAAPHPHVWK